MLKYSFESCTKPKWRESKFDIPLLLVLRNKNESDSKNVLILYLILITKLHHLAENIGCHRLRELKVSFQDRIWNFALYQVLQDNLCSIHTPIISKSITFYPWRKTYSLRKLTHFSLHHSSSYCDAGKRLSTSE